MAEQSIGVLSRDELGKMILNLLPLPMWGEVVWNQVFRATSLLSWVVPWFVWGRYFIRMPASSTKHDHDDRVPHCAGGKTTLSLPVWRFQSSAVVSFPGLSKTARIWSFGKMNTAESWNSHTCVFTTSMLSCQLNCSPEGLCLSPFVSFTWKVIQNKGQVWVSQSLPRIGVRSPQGLL